MAERGWYPDPGGKSGHFRYWDGTSWSTETTDNPHQDAPRADPQTPTHRRWWPAAGALALVLIMIATLVMAVYRTGVQQADVHTQEPTRSSWNDSSPAATPTPRPPATSAPERQPPPEQHSPAPTQAPKTPQPGDCGKKGTSDDFAKQSDQQRISGGGLSFDHHEAPWIPVVTNDYTLWMTWADQIGGEMDVITSGHNALMFAGRVRRVHKEEETPRKAAERLTLCEIQSFRSQGLTVSGSQRLVSRAVTVDGHEGWSVRTQVAVDDLQNNAEGDDIEFTVVDTGKELSFFFGEIPYPDPTRIAIMDRTIETLQVS